MTQLRRIATAASIGAAVLAYATATPAQPAPDRADEDAIRKVITEMTSGFNSHDGRAASIMYLPDAKLTTVRGEVMNGQAAIEKGLSAIFATNAAHRTLDVSVKFIRPDVALAHVTNELSGLVGPDGQGLPSHQELSLRVFVKDAGDWRVAAFHNTMVRPFASAPR
jgi:uncharacterized protein (TIGR02246 family)